MSDSKVLQRLLDLRQRLELARDLAKHGFNEAEHRLQSVVTTMELLREEDLVKDVEAVSLESNSLVAELRGKKTQLQALIAIARKNNGKLLTKDAKRLLQQAGLMKQTKNASNILYNVINRSERFKHTGSGEYELREPFSSSHPVKLKPELEAMVNHTSPKPVQ